MTITYQSYVNKVVQMTLASNYQQQLKFIQSSPKFKGGEAQEFPGYTIITTPAKEDSFNNKINQEITQLQATLKQQLDDRLFVTVPPETFHITIADLIWDQAYKSAVQENGDFDELLIAEIDKIFANSNEILTGVESLDLEVVGLSIFPRAIAVCFIPTEASYEKLIKLRQLIYQNKQIINLGIEQQYDFVGHVTLGYFNEIPEDLDYEKVESIVKTVNQEWITNDLPMFNIKQWELRKFSDMLTYTRQPEWASIKLVK